MSTPSTVPSEHSESELLQQLLKAKSLEELAVGAHLAVLVVLVAAFHYFVSGAPEYAALPLWVLGLVGICLVELAIKLSLGPKNSAQDEHTQARILLTTCIGFGLYSAAVFAPQFAASDSNGKVLLAGAVFILATSAAITRHTLWLGSLGAIGPALPLFAVLVLHSGEETIQWLGLFCVLGWVGVIGLAWLLNKSFRNRTVLSLQKEILLENIEVKMRELDELRELEFESRKEAEAANRSKSRFLAYVSHDLKQPLHALNLLVETIPENSATPATQSIIERIRGSLNMLTELFDSLLDLALLTTGKVEVNVAQINLQEMLASIAQEFEPMASSRGIKIHNVQSSAYANADQIILRRMVQNLVSNAIKHSGCDRVLIGVRRAKHALAIEVRDNGRGISPEDQSHILEEFTRGSATRNETAPQGLGLGLAIVRRLGETLGLEIMVRSDTGKGAVFRISGLEPAPEPATTPARYSSQTGVSDLKTRVLVVDDDPEILNATRALLEKWGYEVFTQPGADFEIETPPHIMVCDFELQGGRTGMDVIDRLRSHFDQPIPALVITGNPSLSMTQTGLEDPIPLLRKPIRPVQLRSAILTALSSSALPLRNSTEAND